MKQTQKKSALACHLLPSNYLLWIGFPFKLFTHPSNEFTHFNDSWQRGEQLCDPCNPRSPSLSRVRVQNPQIPLAPSVHIRTCMYGRNTKRTAWCCLYRFQLPNWNKAQFKKTPTTDLSLSRTLKRNVSYMSAKENNFTRPKAAWNFTWFTWV